MTDSTTALTVEERATWRTLSLMHRQLTAALGHELAADGLSHSDFLVLATLVERPDGRARVVELGEELGWEKSRASHHVARMHQRGLVEKERCPTDRRGSYVVVTATGHRAVQSATPAYVRAVRRYFVDPLTSAQLRVVRDASSTVLDHLAGTRG